MTSANEELRGPGVWDEYASISCGAPANGQCACRVSRLTGLIGRRAGKWHCDVKEPARRRLVEEPPDVLAITPESLEAMLFSTRTPARRFLAHIRAVVIDEVHAFAGDDRGAHLVA